MFVAQSVYIPSESHRVGILWRNCAYPVRLLQICRPDGTTNKLRAMILQIYRPDGTLNKLHWSKIIGG